MTHFRINHHRVAYRFQTKSIDMVSRTLSCHILDLYRCHFMGGRSRRKTTSITPHDGQESYHLNGQLMSSLLIFICRLSHGTMKYTLKAHVCYFILMVGLLHLMGNIFNNWPKILKLIVRVRIYHTSRTRKEVCPRTW
jgi:hypothetical protein